MTVIAASVHMFGFHSDELCAYHLGSLQPDVIN
jgi:hypothetical protein